MADHNRISATLSSEDRAAVLAAVDTIKSKLPFLLSLEPGEIRELPRLGPKTLNFDEGCTSYMEKHPELVPAFIDVKEVNKDRLLRAQIADIVRSLSTLAQDAEDTLAVIAHEVYNADLAFYQNVKQAAKRGILSAQSAYADLSERFPGRGNPGAGTEANADKKTLAAAN
ncbi:MAG: hypothetical protein QM790_10490 [Nibricoccus sp.]